MATISIKSFSQPEKIECPHCNSTITLYDPAGSEFCACGFCKSYIQFVDEVPKVIKNLSPTELKPTIPLGSEGTLQDIPFKVIGYIEKDEGNKAYPGWREYVLYNYETGHAILSEYNGHWNFIQGKAYLPNLEKVKYGNGYVVYDEYEYKLFHKYTPRTLSLLGEFDWDVVNEKVNTSEFIAPPYIIARETGYGTKKKDVEYYFGEYLEPEVIANAFNLDVNLFPAKVDIISNQPSKAYADWKWSLQISLYLVLALLAIQFFVVWLKPEQVLVDSVYNLTYTPEKGINEFKPFVSSAFNVTDDSSPLEITIGSGIDNNWLETTVVLVNEATNQTWEVTKGIEYYQGWEEGERWSEGETSGEVLLSEIPKGKYHLNIYTASGDPLRDALSIKVMSNVTLWRNLLVCIFVLSLFPAYTYLRMRNFEKRRWSNSDYSPFEQ